MLKRRRKGPSFLHLDSGLPRAPRREEPWDECLAPHPLGFSYFSGFPNLWPPQLLVFLKAISPTCQFLFVLTDLAHPC